VCLIWMVHHGLAPGRDRQLRPTPVVVDLLAFPKARFPGRRPEGSGCRPAEATL